MEGEYIIEGYKYIGKAGFKRTLDGLKAKMIKGEIKKKLNTQYLTIDLVVQDQI